MFSIIQFFEQGEKNKMMKENKEKNNVVVWGVSSLACGISSNILFLMPYFGLPLSILGMVFYGKSKKSGLGIAGLVLSIIGCVINTIMLLLVGFALLFAFAY